MKLSELNSLIIDNNSPRFNLFYGDECKVMDIYIEHMIGRSVRIDTDSVAKALSECRKRGISNKPKCIIVHGDEEFIKAEKSWDIVKQEFEKSQNRVIIRYTQLDKRRSFYKHFQDDFVQFEYLSDDVLLKHIDGLSEKNAIDLISRCENDYGKILLESDKVKILSDATGRTLDDSYRILAEQGLLYVPFGKVDDVVKKFSEAILYGDINRAFKQLEKVKLVGAEPLLVLAYLYNGFKAMLLVQGSGNCSDLTAKTGLNYYIIKNTKELMGGYSTKELKKALDVIVDVEQSIKSGKIIPSIALDYTVINIMREE